MKNSDDIDELYTWVNSRYEEYSEDKITEEEYLKDLEFYKRRLTELDVKEEPTTKQEVDEEKKKSISPQTVRSTSIAGLRKKLMEEMKK